MIRRTLQRSLAGFKLAFGLHHPGRNLNVFPDDVFIVSYPKSGNTWTRFLIANLVYPDKNVDFSNLNELTPDPEAFSKRRLNSLPRPRIIKSHQYFDPRYARVIYIVRDPRDVAVSHYFFHRKRRLIQDDAPIEEFIKRYTTGETSRYASWGENVASWVSTRHGTPGFLLLRYEDMLQNTPRELAKIASVLQLPATPDLLAQAAERSSASRMRELEKKQASLWTSTRNTRQDIPFVRSAGAGGWKTALSPAAVAEIERAWGPLMRWLGYETVTESQGGIEPIALQSVVE